MESEKKGGWERYSLLSDEYSEKLGNIVESKETSIEEKIGKFDRIHDTIKYKSFGKVTITGNKNKNTEGKEDEDVSKNKSTKDDIEEQERKAEEEIEDIKQMKLSKVRKVWEIRKRILGGKKSELQASAIINPVTEKLVVSKNKIKEVTLNYCKETLTNNIPDEAYEHDRKKERFEQEIRNCTETFQISKDTFNMTISKFKRSRKRNYDFLVKAGKGFQNSVLKFCKVMIEEEKYPESFKKTTLHMIFKGGRGRKEKLSDSRFIHSKNWFPRTAKACLVEEGMKRQLIDGSSIYQIGGQPGHRSEEHVFSLKLIIAKYRSQGKLVIIQTSDIAKFFEKE